VIVDEFGRGRHASLATLVEDDSFMTLAVYNTGVAGPVRARLKTLPNYVESAFSDGAAPGDDVDGVRHEDLLRLSFDDGSFDLVTSSHVMEHVANPRQAFTELHRVLRPGGRLVFSIPVPWPPPSVSVTRALLQGSEVEHVLAPVYHESPGGEPSLVFTDFGTDLLDLLDEVGFIAGQRRPHTNTELAFRDSVFVAVKR
jgi:SAM-dependent methyltransferase